jgi:hypothetical protein
MARNPPSTKQAAAAQTFYKTITNDEFVKVTEA